MYANSTKSTCTFISLVDANYDNFRENCLSNVYEIKRERGETGHVVRSCHDKDGYEG